MPTMPASKQAPTSLADGTVMNAKRPILLMPDLAVVS